jgi:transcriptional regulator with XRE-family HTH domain
VEMRERIAYLRKKARMSQAELARQTHIAQPTIHAYEAGNRPPRGMSVENAISLARTFGVTLDYLCGVYDNADEEHTE